MSLSNPQRLLRATGQAEARVPRSWRPHARATALPDFARVCRSTLVNSLTSATTVPSVHSSSRAVSVPSSRLSRSLTLVGRRNRWVALSAADAGRGDCAAGRREMMTSSWLSSSLKDSRTGSRGSLAGENATLSAPVAYTVQRAARDGIGGDEKKTTCGRRGVSIHGVK